jgi:tRNA(fMet)-specific endonuclease VapC
MTIYIFDTDHLSLYGRNHPAIVMRVNAIQTPLITTAINAEEQLRGRLAQIGEAKDEVKQAIAYQWLTETMTFLSTFQILQYTTPAQAIYQMLKAQRLRVGTQDLRIAAIALAYNGTLLTRNLKDFERIPNLSIQDWSI